MYKQATMRTVRFIIAFDDVRIFLQTPPMQRRLFPQPIPLFNYHI